MRLWVGWKWLGLGNNGEISFISSVVGRHRAVKASEERLLRECTRHALQESGDRVKDSRSAVLDDGWVGGRFQHEGDELTLTGSLGRRG